MPKRLIGPSIPSSSKENTASEKIVLDSKKAYSNRFHTNGGNEAYSVMAHTLRDIYGTDV